MAAPAFQLSRNFRPRFSFSIIAVAKWALLIRRALRRIRLDIRKKKKNLPTSVFVCLPSSNDAVVLTGILTVDNSNRYCSVCRSFIGICCRDKILQFGFIGKLAIKRIWIQSETIISLKQSASTAIFKWLSTNVWINNKLINNVKAWYLISHLHKVLYLRGI